MDQYQYVTNADAETVADYLRRHHTAVFAYNPDNGSAFQVFLTLVQPFMTIGKPEMQGGTVVGRLMFGMRHKGCAVFQEEETVHWNYVAEKLNLSQGDAEPIADFIDKIWAALRKY